MKTTLRRLKTFDRRHRSGVGRWNGILLAVGIAALVGEPVERAAAAAYVFTNIADTASGFDPGFGTPSVNTGGTVAFYGNRPADSGIFTGFGGAVTAIATDAAAGQFAGFGRRPSINASGIVAFEGDLDNGNSGLFKGNGGATSIAQDAGAFSAFGAPTINAGGNVAFFASFDAGGSAISAGAGGAVTTIDSSTGPRGGYGTAPTINTLNTVAFRADLDAGGSGIFTGNNGSMPVTIAQTSTPGFSAFGNPSINDGGTVAFRAEKTTGVNGIYKGSGATTPVVESGGNLFSDFAEAVSINTPGSIAFVGFLFAGGRGIYVDTNGARDEVIRTGDALFGSTVSAFELGNTAFNDAGQVAFFYQLSNGRTGIALASVPEAGSCALLVAGAGFLTGRRRRCAWLPD